MENTTRKFVPKSARLMDQVREILRIHHYAFSIEKSCVDGFCYISGLITTGAKIPEYQIPRMLFNQQLILIKQTHFTLWERNWNVRCL